MKLFRKKKNNFEIGKIVVNEENNLLSTGGHGRLKDNILYLNADGKNKVIQVESSVQSEGKTTAICNLAVSLGLTSKKVVLVDLDFHRPRVHRTLEIERENGIAEYMLGSLDKKDIIKKTKYNNVDVITRGAEIYNATLVLMSDKFKDLIKQLREEYDFVLLDCPPVLQVSDYIHICKISDGVLFLVAYASTTKAQVSAAIKELRNNGANILGTAFTLYDKKKDNSHYASGHYGYGYHYGCHAKDDEEDSIEKA